MIVGSFADGNVVQIIFFAVLFGAGITRLGARGKPAIDGIGSPATCGKMIVAVYGTVRRIVNMTEFTVAEAAARKRSGA